MSDLQFILNGVNDVPPAEWAKLELQLAWDNDNPSASLATSQFTFEGTANERLHDWVANGTNGGIGILEGTPYEIQDCNNLTALKGCVDLADASAEFSCSRIVAPIKDTRIRDYLLDNWDGFSFAYLASGDPNIVTNARISTADYIDIPYTISDIPNYSQLLSIGIAGFTIEQQIADVIRNVATIVAELSPPTTILGIAETIIYLIYLTLIVIALIKLCQLFIDQIFQFAKYKKGMHVRTLFQKGCAYLGINFSSSIFNNPSSVYYNTAIIPQKIQRYDNNNIISFKRPQNEQGSITAYGYEDGDFGEFCRNIENIFYGKCRLLNGVLSFERSDNFNIQSGLQFPDLDLKGVNNGTWQYNCSELASNYYASWKVDSTDLNTMDDFTGTNAQMQATLTTIGDPKNNLLRGKVRVDFYYSQGIRKKQLTKVENELNNIISGVANFVNTITSVLNAIGSINIPQLPTNILNNRIGWLLLSSDYFNNSKMVILDSSNKIDSQSEIYLGAEYLLSNFHFAAFPLSNQWLIYKNWEIPFCCEDYVKVVSSNLCKTFYNRDAKITNLRWQIGSDIAIVDFKVRPDNINQRYDDNITQIIMTDNA